MKETRTKRTVRLSIAGFAGLAVGVVAAMVLSSRSPAPGEHGSDQRQERQAYASDVTSSRQPVADAHAQSRRRTSSVRNRATRPGPASAKPAVAASTDVLPEQSPIGREPDEKDWDAKMVASDVMHVANAVSGLSPTESDTPVTITGCLETSTSGDAFRLTDTEGADAPKSRGWRTGFLKKRSIPVALVEAPDAVPLKANVGRRVAATGLLASRELKIHLLRVVDASCD